LRDGMNLVAKEFVAAQNPEDPGVLVLSRFAGAANELQAALLVNPIDTDGMAVALRRGLAMSREERVERWQAMMQVLRRNTIATWCAAFLGALAHAPQLEVQPVFGGGLVPAQPRDATRAAESPAAEDVLIKS
jgi:trehalose 6-phosphate synthase